MAAFTLIFLFWGFIKDKVYRTPIPANLAQLRHRITAAVQEVTPDMLQRVWQEIDFRWDDQWCSYRALPFGTKLWIKSSKRHINQYCKLFQ
ncbi:hypothetical protein C0J52_13869 [Blattella germanica]|nr:hypothetical protein C0J52_13869 [Blattella germanica]